MSNPQAYERWMGRWSTCLAPLFVRFAGLESPGRYLDVGAGTGVLARAIADEFGDAEVVGIEPAASYVDHARARLRDPRFRFELGDAQAIPFDNDSFDAALALLLLQEVPDAPMAVAEMRRVTRSGGCLATSQWDFRRGMPMLSLFWEAVQEVIPGERTRREAARHCQAIRTKARWPGCGNRRAWTGSKRRDWKSPWTSPPSTITGRRFWAGRPPRLPMPQPWPTT